MKSSSMNQHLSEQLSEGCPDNPLIQMIDIVKTFKTSAGDFTALKGVSVCFYPGEFVSVVGRSGSGKSTLTNMITGIDHPTSGIVRVGDTHLHQLGESKMSAWRGRNLGIVFQFFQLLPMLSLLENVMLPMDFCDRYAPAERERRARTLLAMVGLEDTADQLPGAISGGQQQSVAIARALANDPPILIADEPTGNLDSRTAETVFGIFKDLARQGKTILMVTHDRSLAARTERMLYISDGVLIDPQAAQAFPNLSHERLLWLTQNLSPVRLQPGQGLRPLGSPTAGMYLVIRGEIEIEISSDMDRAAAILQPGEGVTVFEQQAFHPAKLYLRAGGSPAEVLALDLSLFHDWMKADPSTEAELQLAARDRGVAWGVARRDL